MKRLLETVAALPVLLAVPLFALSLHAVRVPPDHLLLVFSGKTLRDVAAAGLLGVALYVAFRLGAVRTGAADPGATARHLLVPLHLLLLQPLAVFVLYPLGWPAPLLVLVTPVVTGLAVGAALAHRLLVHARAFVVRLPDAVTAAPARYLAGGLFVLFLALFVGATRTDNRRDLLVGDEPHYLLTMQSLRRFGTADLTRVLHEADLGEGMQRVRPHRSEASAPGTTYEVHGVGLPVLLILPYALAGYGGVALFFNVVTALVIAQTFLFACEVTGMRWTSALAAALIGLSVPFVVYFRFVYPEVVAALLALYALRVVRAGSRSPWAVAVAGLGAAYLPWLHVKYALLAASLAGLAAVRFRHRRGRLVAFLLPFLPAALALMAFFLAAYGSWRPTAQYGRAGQPLSAFFFRGAPGLFFDRDHGLFAFAPLYLFALTGAVPLWRRSRADSLWLAALAAPTFAVLASHWMWWGGPSPPARFLIPLLPLAAPALVLALAEYRRPAYGAALAFAVAVTLTLSALAMSPAIVRELTWHSHWAKRFVVSVDAFPSLPSFFYHKTAAVPVLEYAVLGCWLIPSLLLLLPGLRPAGAGAEGSNRGLLLAIGFCLLWPGVPALINALPPAPQAEGSSDTLARLNYDLEAYAWPLHRAGVAPDGLAGRLPAVSLHAVLPVGKRATRLATAAEPKKEEYFAIGPYTPLFPVRYTARFFVEVDAARGEEAGKIDVSADSGRTILAVAPLTGDGGRTRRRIDLEFRPDRILRSGEFRAALTGVGTVRLDRVELTVRLGPEAAAR